MNTSQTTQTIPLIPEKAYTAFEISSVGENIRFAVDDSGDGVVSSPDEFEDATGYSWEDLINASASGEQIYILDYAHPFTVERMDIDPEQVAKDTAWSETPEAQELLKLIDEAAKNGTLNALFSRYKC